MFATRLLHPSWNHRPQVIQELRSYANPEPQAEHLWLHQLVGEWRIESECIMGPDQPPMKTTGREVVRPLGQLWTIGEGSGNTPEGGSCDSIMDNWLRPPGEALCRNIYCISDDPFVAVRWFTRYDGKDPNA